MYTLIISKDRIEFKAEDHSHYTDRIINRNSAPSDGINSLVYELSLLAFGKLQYFGKDSPCSELIFDDLYASLIEGIPDPGEHMEIYFSRWVIDTVINGSVILNQCQICQYTLVDRNKIICLKCLDNVIQANSSSKGH